MKNCFVSQPIDASKCMCKLVNGSVADSGNPTESLAGQAGKGYSYK